MQRTPHPPVCRALGFLLLMLFGLPLVSPLFALSGSLESRLPACCRRAGAHHCTSSMQMASPSTPTFRAIPDVCPVYPQHTDAVSHADLSAPTVALFFAEAISHPALHRQTQARARVALDRARHKRGPPQDSL